MKRIRLLATLCFAAIASACSGGSHGVMPGTPPASTGKRATATFTIAVPPRTTSDTARRPAYISPDTQSASIALVSVNGSPVTQPPVVLNLTPTSAGCSSSSGTLTCTGSVPAPVGSDTFTLTLFSATNAGGSQLSAGQATATIVAGQTNTVAVTLNGIVAAVAISLGNPSPPSGTAATIPVSVIAKDARGATIIPPGNYNPAITLTDSDTSGATSLSTTNVVSPSTAVTLAYNGSASLTSATISATVSGVASSQITPATLTPKTAAAETVSGAAAFAVVADGSGNAVAYIPTSSGLSTIVVATKGALQSVARRLLSAGRKTAAAASIAPLAISPAPDECAPDLAHNQLYCMSFGSNVISVVGFTTSSLLSPPTLLGQTKTDAPSTGVNFSGATCIVCGIAYDPKDSAVIISTANGYELWSTTAGASAPIKTIATRVSENFGYNGNTNQIFSAWYQCNVPCSTTGATLIGNGLDVVDVASGNRYVLTSPPTTLAAPDAGAVDTKTNIAFAPEEASVPIYLDNLNAPPDTFTAPTSANIGSYSSNVASVNPGSSLIANGSSLGCDETYSAADSVKDLGFFGSEYCPFDYAAVAKLPTTSGGTLGFSSYVALQLPNTPDGHAFSSPLDPHAAIVVNLPGICADCGVLFNRDKSWLAVIDLNAMLALNPTGSGEYDVPSSTLLTGVLTYIGTGVSSPPTSAYVRALAAHARFARPRMP